jgi:hypothetical protein
MKITVYFKRELLGTKEFNWSANLDESECRALLKGIIEAGDSWMTVNGPGRTIAFRASEAVFVELL